MYSVLVTTFSDGGIVCVLVDLVLHLLCALTNNKISEYISNCFLWELIDCPDYVCTLGQIYQRPYATINISQKWRDSGRHLRNIESFEVKINSKGVSQMYHNISSTRLVILAWRRWKIQHRKVALCYEREVVFETVAFFMKPVYPSLNL